MTKYGLVLMLAMLASGCATQSKLKPINPSNPPQLKNIEHWQLEARVAIKTPEDSVTASLDWQKNGREFDFHLSGAFGVTLAHLIQQKQQATLDIPDQEQLVHFDAQVLLQQALGWDFPIDALSYWVKGLPSDAPGEIIKRDQLGRIQQIDLGYWRIDVTRYKRFHGYELPKMIKAKHPNMSLKVVAKNWSFFQK
jgi:outer membrane lipoprotein LolB